MYILKKLQTKKQVENRGTSGKQPERGNQLREQTAGQTHPILQSNLPKVFCRGKAAAKWINGLLQNTQEGGVMNRLALSTYHDV